jgi:glycosyltransferase involved in cell wall biosynthesis
MYCTAMDRASRIITPSQFSLDQIKRVFHLATPKLMRVYPYVETFGVDQKMKVRERKFKVIHVGGIEQRKNTRLLCEAFIAAYDHLPPLDKDMACLNLVGRVSYRDYGQQTIDWIIDLAKRYPIHYKGVVADQELDELYQSSSILLFPSEFEGFGMPIIEAMTRGVPCIVSDRGAMKEVAGKAAFYVDCLDPVALSQSMLEIFKNHELYRKLVRKGLKRARIFNFQRTKSQLLQAINGCFK